MMGSEVIRLNDKAWSQQFQEALKEDYEVYATQLVFLDSSFS